MVVDTWTTQAAHVADYIEVASKIRENMLFIWARERFGRLRPTAIALRQTIASAYFIGLGLLPLLLAWLALINNAGKK